MLLYALERYLIEEIRMCDLFASLRRSGQRKFVVLLWYFWNLYCSCWGGFCKFFCFKYKAPAGNACCHFLVQVVGS